MSNSTSRWVQLTEYCLLEYRYTSVIAPEDYSFNFTRVQNNAAGYVHILNEDSADDTTRNVRERSAVQVSPGSYVDTDKDQLPHYFDYDPNMVTTTVTAANCPYDELRFHLLAGYNFEDLDGIMMQVAADERSGNKLVLANLVFLKDSDYFEYNPKPVLMGDKLYDKYVKLKVPSVKLNNDIYYSLEGNPTQPLTFVAKITSNGMGFLRANPLKVSVIEIKSTVPMSVGPATYVKYNIGATKTVAINQSDEFALLGAVVQDSPGGDYFEYFATWAGGFIEDYIGQTQGLPGYDYMVIHELRVLEQVGSLFVQTAFFQSIQETDFDQPNLFRPIVINAGTAVSFTIEYVMRLYNKADSQQIIRTASYTDYNAKAWGKQFTKLKLLNEPEPYRVYNKVVSGPQLPETTFVNSVLPVTVAGANGGKTEIITKMVPAFFDRTIVTVQSDTVYLDTNGQLQLNASSTTQPVYGQGDATIVMSPFDNYFKFTVLKTETSAGNVPSPLDLGQNAQYMLVFINNEGMKMRYPFIADAKIGDPQSGDLIFKVPGSDAVNILEFKNRQFWIVSKFSDSDAETGVYYGEFVTVDEMENKRDREKAAEERSKVKSAQDARIAELENKLAAAEEALSLLSATATTASTPTAVNATGEGQNVTQDGTVVPAGASAEVVAEINVKVPGLGKSVPKDKKTSVVSNIKPKYMPPVTKKRT